MSKNEQIDLCDELGFSKKKDWEKHWVGMPEFHQEDLTSFRKIVVHFRSQADVDEFAKLIGQRVTPKQPSLWVPQYEIMRVSDKRYVDNES